MNDWLSAPQPVHAVSPDDERPKVISWQRALLMGSLVASTVCAMEVLAWATHRFVMHGWGWGWHRSHHRPRQGLLERNDLYACCFAGAAAILLLPAMPHWARSVGIGMCVYGILYAVLHDGLVHSRWPFQLRPRNRYLRHLIQAHRMHHASSARTGAVSFGFLYAPPVRKLAAQMRERRRS